MAVCSYSLSKSVRVRVLSYLVDTLDDFSLIEIK